MKIEKDILLIDDDFEYARLLSFYITNQGYTAYSAYNGKEGLEQAKYHPDLILLDLIMPDMNGYEVCSKLQEDKDTRDIPIIMLTATEDAKEHFKKLRLRVDDYITKPFEFKDLLVRIERILKKRDEIQRKKEEQGY